MGHLAKQRDASFLCVFFNSYRYGVLTVIRYSYFEAIAYTGTGVKGGLKMS